MKTINTLLIVLFLSLLSFPSWSESFNDLVERDGLYYKKFSNAPFIGEVTGVIQGSVKNGEEEGTWFYYSPNGQLSSKLNFKNGVMEGPSVFYNRWGQVSAQGNWTNDEREGAWVFYNDDGSIDEYMTGTYKNNRKIRD